MSYETLLMDVASYDDYYTHDDWMSIIDTLLMDVASYDDYFVEFGQ